MEELKSIREEQVLTNIQKTEAFLREQFAGCSYFRQHPADGEYRLQHSYRAAHAAREIARREGLDEEGLVIGGLLHDVGYSLPFETEDGWIYQTMFIHPVPSVMLMVWFIFKFIIVSPP